MEPVGEFSCGVGFPVTIFREMRPGRFGILACALLLPACYDFHQVGPEDPPALPSPATVTIEVVYNRPSECVNVRSPCGGPVTFQASWMKLGAYITLRQSAPHSWVATISGVPINWPGNEPHHVYAVDPYLLDTATNGVSADRLTVAGERIVKFENPGGSREQGLIYIDANGKGRTPS